MYGGQAFSLSDDRNGTKSSALKLLSNGYLQAPAGIYFNLNFSVTFWVYLLEQPPCWSRVLDFGNGPSSDNFYIAFCNPITLITQYYKNYTNICSFQSLPIFAIKTWYFIYVGLQDRIMNIYVDGKFATKLTASEISTKVTRTLNYIGKSNWNRDRQVSQKLDDLKIFNRALDEKEILIEMNSSVNSNIRI